MTMNLPDLGSNTLCPEIHRVEENERFHGRSPRKRTSRRMRTALMKMLLLMVMLIRAEGKERTSS
eukprot:9093010-Pyramimonas_sp.AAC.1